MPTEAVRVRPGRATDLDGCRAIHDWYVEHGSATFDEAPQPAEAWARWFERFTDDGLHRLLVADDDGAVVGYASSTPYRAHPAFARTVEASVYVDHRHLGRGLGGELYDVLLGALDRAGAHAVLAGVALPNPGSVALHLAKGFREVGTYTEYAWVHDHYVSSCWFERVRDEAD